MKVFIVHVKSSDEKQPIVKTVVASSFAQVGAFADSLTDVLSISEVNSDVTLL